MSENNQEIDYDEIKAKKKKEFHDAFWKDNQNKDTMTLISTLRALHETYFEGIAGIAEVIGEFQNLLNVEKNVSDFVGQCLKKLLKLKRKRQEEQN